jgi:hypothetical protein
MSSLPKEKDYADRSRILKILGLLLLIAGIGFGILAPLETYCYYLFSQEGSFHYEGFGFGSFMFANITGQIVAYYGLAVIGIVLGYGHWNIRKWARRLTAALLWTWVVVGAPLTAGAAFLFLGQKDPSIAAAATATGFFGFCYLILPWLLIRFYKGRNVRRTFEAHDLTNSWIEDLPMPILVLSALFVFFAVVIHMLVLFRGIFPAFGKFLYGIPGILSIACCTAALLVLLWGTLRRKRWAWWAALIVWGGFTLSLVVTFIFTRYADLLAEIGFPSREVEILKSIPLQGYHLALLFGLPCLAAWVVLLLSKPTFDREK